MNPIDKYFPKLTYCSLQTYSAPGLETSDHRICILPLNIVNEKIYAILWFWFIILSAISALAVVFRILVINIPKLQIYMLLGQLRMPYNAIAVNNLVERYGFGGYFVLHLLGKNVNPLIFKELINELAKDMKLIKENERNMNYDNYAKV